MHRRFNFVFTQRQNECMEAVCICSMYSRSDNTSLRYKIVDKIYFFSTEMDTVSFYGRKTSKIRISSTCGIIESSSDVYATPIPGNSAISDCESDEDSGDEATSYFLVKLNFINNLTINLNYY